MPVCIVSPYLRDLRHCKHSRTELTSQIYKQIINLANNMRNISEQDLVPMNKQPPEVQREFSRKGGRNSGKSRREKRAMADVLRMMIEQPIPANQRNAVQALKKLGISSADATNAALINLQLVNLALSSSVDNKTKLRAIELIHRFIDGQKVDVTTNGKDVAKEPLVVQVIDSREQVDKQDNEDTGNEDL